MEREYIYIFLSLNFKILRRYLHKISSILIFPLF